MESASPAFVDAAIAEVPLGRMGVPADIAPTIVFLVSDDSAYYNGAEIVIDGGLTAHVSHKGIADATGPGAMKLGYHQPRWPCRASRRRRRLPAPRRLTVGAMVELGLERALYIGARRSQGEPIPFAGRDLLLPYKPPSIRDFVTFESHVEGVRRASTMRRASRRRGTTHRRSTSPTRTRSTAPAHRSRSRRLPRTRLRDGGRRSRPRGPAPSRGADAIFGYTIFNDWSARDIQSREMKVGLGPAKGKDFATSIGPWIVTADELAPYLTDDGFLDLDCRVTVNGEPIGHDRLSHMHWTFPRCSRTPPATPS